MVREARDERRPEAAERPAAPPGRRRLPLVLAVAAAIVAVDQATKLWAQAALTGREPIRALGDFIQFRLLYNPGAAFSIGEGSTWILTILAGVTVVAILRFAARVRSPGWAAALGLLLGGASTHLLDRLFRSPGLGVGHVVDFIDYNGWFVGNVADIALTFGTILLIVLTFIGTDLDGRRAGTRGQDPPPGA
jgi:signal peptidase II